jgi:hypothetical protein
MLADAFALSSAPPPGFSENDKAFYASEAQVNFVRPGLVFNITGVTVAVGGTVTARAKTADPRGLPLDREGIFTPGPISASFILANIPSGAKQYVSYTTRTQTSPITAQSAVQAGAGTGGAWTQVAEGEYDYRFGKKLPAGYDLNATHTVAVYGSRNLTGFDFPTSYDDATFDWVPSGAAVTVTRDVIKTATCNKCHDQLGLHGGSRRTMGVCVLCHTPQTLAGSLSSLVLRLELVGRTPASADTSPGAANVESRVPASRADPWSAAAPSSSTHSLQVRPSLSM